MCASPTVIHLIGFAPDTGFALVTINMDNSAITGARFLKKYDIDIPDSMFTLSNLRNPRN